jgi:hypothetical protein
VYIINVLEDLLTLTQQLFTNKNPYGLLLYVQYHMAQLTEHFKSPSPHPLRKQEDKKYKETTMIANITTS